MPDTPMPWIKLYTRMLDDTKIALVPDVSKWRFVQLLLLAGQLDAEGYLVDSDNVYNLDEIAWRLRIDVQQLDDDMKILKEVELIAKYDDMWLIPSFSKCQGRTQREKRAKWREHAKNYRRLKKMEGLFKSPPIPHSILSSDEESDMSPEVLGGEGDIEGVGSGDSSSMTNTEAVNNVTRDKSVSHDDGSGYVMSTEGEEEEEAEKTRGIPDSDNRYQEEGEEFNLVGTPEFLLHPDSLVKTYAVRYFMNRYGLEDLLNKQIRALNALERQYGEEKLTSCIDWAVGKDIPPGRAVQAIRKAIRDWRLPSSDDDRNPNQTPNQAD
jgi:hypothetical protein